MLRERESEGELKLGGLERKRACNILGTIFNVDMSFE